MCNWEGVLDVKNEEYVVFDLLSSHALLLLLLLFWGICPQQTKSSCSAWGPISCLRTCFEAEFAYGPVFT